MYSEICEKLVSINNNDKNDNNYNESKSIFVCHVKLKEYFWNKINVIDFDCDFDVQISMKLKITPPMESRNIICKFCNYNCPYKVVRIVVFLMYPHYFLKQICFVFCIDVTSVCVVKKLLVGTVIMVFAFLVIQIIHQNIGTYFQKLKKMFCNILLNASINMSNYHQYYNSLKNILDYVALSKL